jgi:hypothetical protein
MPATPQAGTNGNRATRTPATTSAGPIGTPDDWRADRIAR